jgi:hypothetical protein
MNKKVREKSQCPYIVIRYAEKPIGSSHATDAIATCGNACPDLGQAGYVIIFSKCGVIC